MRERCYQDCRDIALESIYWHQCSENTTENPQAAHANHGWLLSSNIGAFSAGFSAWQIRNIIRTVLIITGQYNAAYSANK